MMYPDLYSYIIKCYQYGRIRNQFFINSLFSLTIHLKNLEETQIYYGIICQFLTLADFFLF